MRLVRHLDDGIHAISYFYYQSTKNQLLQNDGQWIDLMERLLKKSYRLIMEDRVRVVLILEDLNQCITRHCTIYNIAPVKHDLNIRLAEATFRMGSDGQKFR